MIGCVMVVALVAAGCGSDDGATSARATETTTADTNEVPMPDPTTPTTPDDTTSPDASTATALPTAGSATTAEAAPTTVARPDGPAADLSEELTGGAGVFMGEPLTTDLDAAGYSEHEYVAAGTATSYTSSERTSDGRWTFTPDGSAPYRTRVLVRMPADPADFSGTVVLEWLNVSGGADANPEWAGIHEEVIREGHAWVGVSAQMIGVRAARSS